MKKTFFALLLSLSISLSAQNQMKTLQVEDITPALSVYPCGDRHEALVVIHCPESFPLTFSSNTDSELNISKASDGSETIYNIVFLTRANGTSFKGRQLSIAADGFIKYYLPLELNDKEKHEFLVTDPYSKLRSIYYTSVEDGCRLFEKGEYLEAKDMFNKAKQCPEYANIENNIDNYLARCDSMIYWNSMFTQAESRQDLKTALDYLEIMMNANPSCELLSLQYNNVSTEFNRLSTYYLNVGTQYMEDGKYDLARDCFEQAVAMQSPSASQAALNLESISLMNYKSDNNTRTIFYQQTENCKIGFMSASLKPEKAGSYFSLCFNNDCLDLIGSNKDYTIRNNYEFTAAIGWTLRLFYPENKYIPHVWALLTPFGYAGWGSKSYDEDGVVLWEHHNELSPEIGLAIRSWRILFNYKLQYRYPLDGNGASGDKKIVNSFGIGFCW